MDQSVKKIWLAALRSGKFLQGRKWLRQSNGQDRFCCLGVLQEIVEPKAWKQDMEGKWSANGCSGGLSGSFMELVGLDETHTSDLVDLNDGKMSVEGYDDVPDTFDDEGEPKDFEYIAHWIETRL